MKLYRVMKVAADGKPQVGTGGSMLGVRPTDPHTTNAHPVFDVAAVRDTDLVHPGAGLSTSSAPDSRQPRRGQAVFEIDTADLGPNVRPHEDHPGHVMLEPAQSMTLGEYQQALADTRELWKPVQ